VTPEQASRRVGLMRAALGAEALIDGFDDLIEQVRCDPKDRHVLAAAVRGGADTIVTCNLKDFPDEAGAPYGIGICHPDSFLVQLPSEHTDTVVSSGWPCHPWVRLDSLDVVSGAAARRRNVHQLAALNHGRFRS